MRRFNAVCGWLMLLVLLAGLVSGGRKGGVAPDLLAGAFIAVIFVWLAVAAAVFLIQVVGTLARCIARDVVRGTFSAGRHDRPRAPVHRTRQIQPASDDLIVRLCRESGWLLVSRENDRYTVRSGDHTPQRHVDVRWSDHFTNVVFTCWFPVRFSLEKEPQGLFARLMMRNTTLKWCSWSMSMGQSCEACLYVAASLPPESLDASLFARVCQEIAGEINAFHSELHDKFRYSVGRVTANPPYPPVQQEQRGGVPMRREDNVPGIWYVE